MVTSLLVSSYQSVSAPTFGVFSTLASPRQLTQSLFLLSLLSSLCSPLCSTLLPPFFLPSYFPASLLLSRQPHQTLFVQLLDFSLCVGVYSYVYSCLCVLEHTRTCVPCKFRPEVKFRFSLRSQPPFI